MPRHYANIPIKSAIAAAFCAAQTQCERFCKYCSDKHFCSTQQSVCWVCRGSLVGSRSWHCVDSLITLSSDEFVNIFIARYFIGKVEGMPSWVAVGTCPFRRWVMAHLLMQKMSTSHRECESLKKSSKITCHRIAWPWLGEKWIFYVIRWERASIVHPFNLLQIHGAHNSPRPQIIIMAVNAGPSFRFQFEHIRAFIRHHFREERARAHTFDRFLMVGIHGVIYSAAGSHR